jgi:hypothetical protein
MSSTFKILFYVRKNYVNKNRKAGIMIRVTLNGEICQFSSISGNRRSKGCSPFVFGRRAAAELLDATLHPAGWGLRE